MHGIGLLGVVLVSLLAGWIAARVMRRRLGLFDSLPIGLLGALPPMNTQDWQDEFARYKAIPQ
jgi:uncharacterized membrane protein YeaQ/YmgE (transglycosylase-associated protein family)